METGMVLSLLKLTLRMTLVSNLRIFDIFFFNLWHSLSRFKTPLTVCCLDFAKLFFLKYFKHKVKFKLFIVKSSTLNKFVICKIASTILKWNELPIRYLFCIQTPVVSLKCLISRNSWGRGSSDSERAHKM